MQPAWFALLQAVSRSLAVLPAFAPAQLCVPVGAAEELVAGLAQLELGLEPNLAEVVEAEQLPFEKLLVKERAQARARHSGPQLGSGLRHPP